jgi:sporulation protein YlmC with PRC-barrel domain
MMYLQPEPGDYDQLARFSDIPGFAVYDLDGEEVGRVNSVLLDQNAHIAYIVLWADYQLETDGQFIPVPWAAIDVLSRQEVLDRFGNDMPAAPEATPISPAETPIVPTPGLPIPTPTQPGDAQPVAPGDNDNNNDNDGAAVQPGQIAITGQQDDQMMAQASHWDRQFALMLNVDRQVLQDAPAFDQVLAENWEEAEWQNDLYAYWGEHTAIVPQTGEDEIAILVQVLDVRGKRVEDQNGQLIGRVFEVILRQPSAQIAYVVVETDSRMGLHGERVAIPQEHLEMRVMAGRNVIVLTADRQMFDDAPRILTERDLIDLHRPGAGQQIQQHWGIVQDVDVTPVAPDPTPVTPENDQTPVTPITTPENDQTPIAPITTPENDQTPVATPLPPVQPVTPVETPEATPIVPEALAPIPETGVIETGFSRYSDLTGLAVFDQNGEEVGRVHSALIDRGTAAWHTLSCEPTVNWRSMDNSQPFRGVR